LKDVFLKNLFLKLRRYIIIFFSGCLTAVVIISLVVFSSSFTIAKTLRSMIPESKLTERIIEKITEKELYRLLSPIIRLDINEVIKSRTEYFIKEYTKIVGREDIVATIINKCLAKDIPINIGFALAWRESGWNPLSSTQNKDGTIDRGLFKLNSKSFKKDTKWFNIDVNAELGLNYLNDKHTQYKSWETALALYNAGSMGNVSSASFEHLTAILQKERELDSLFSDFYKNMGSAQ
jgi:hypothetical protein